MRFLKSKLSVLAVCSAFTLPGAAYAAESPPAVPPAPLSMISIVKTAVNGILVPGNYAVNKDSRVAYIPGGVGLVVVDKSTALPPGAYYLK